MGQRYKLISTKKNDRLYDIIADPAEAKNLIDTRSEIAQKMKYELTQWKTSVMNDLEKVP
jgi:hypothetical protein